MTDEKGTTSMHIFAGLEHGLWRTATLMSIRGCGHGFGAWKGVAVLTEARGATLPRSATFKYVYIEQFICLDPLAFIASAIPKPFVLLKLSTRGSTTT